MLPGINYTDFTRIPLQEQTSPFGNILQGLIQGAQDRRAMEEQRIKNELMKGQLEKIGIENQYGPRTHEANLQNILSGAGLHRAQAENIGIKNKEDALKFALLKQYLEQVQQPTSQLNEQEQLAQQLQSVPESFRATPEQMSYRQGSAQRQSGQQAFNPALAKLLGLGGGVENVYDQNTGQLLTITTDPFGNVSAQPQQVGENSAQREFQKETGKKNAEYTAQLLDQRDAHQNVQDQLEHISTVINDPSITPEVAIGPVNSVFTRYFGDAKAKQLLGTFDALGTNIITGYARAFPGAFRRGEQKILERGKFSPEDTFDVARGKLKTMLLMNQLLIERESLQAKYLSQGMPRTEASDRVVKELPLSVVREQVKEQYPQRIRVQDLTDEELMRISSGGSY